MFSGIRRGRRTIDVWPGYVDVLSSLLMVVIFVLLIFAFAQLMLRQIVSTQEDELQVVHDKLAEITEALGIERERTTGLRDEVARLSGTISSLTEEKFQLSGRVDDLTRQTEQDRQTVEQQLLQLASLQQDIDALRKVREELEGRVGQLAGALDGAQSDAAALRDRSKTLEASLATEQERTHLAQTQVQQRDIRIQALSALVGEQGKALKDERKLSADAQAEVTLLNQKVTDLQARLGEISAALQVAETDKKAQAEQIEDLGRRLNLELARRVNELQRYRSEFFGKLREALGDNPDIRVEGDRFVFQSELLFDSGSADLGAPGRQQLGKLASTLRDVTQRIPAEIDWILRIDGHTDRVPINTPRFPSNWDLSTARAVSVVQYLATQGIPPRRLAATGFGEFRPLDPGSGAEVYRKNRRIEIKLTSP